MALKRVLHRPTWPRRILPPLAWVVILAVLVSRRDFLDIPTTDPRFAQAELAVGYGLQVAFWFSIAFLLNRLVQMLVWDGFAKRRMGFSAPQLIRDLFSGTIYFLAFLGIVALTFHQSVGPIWTATGALSIVVGLALRNVILDFFVGIAINLERPFKIGDFVMLQQGGFFGRVTEINWRTTRLETNEGNTVIVPNNRIGDMVLTNFSDPSPLAEFELIFSLDYAVPVGRALRVLHAGALAAVGTSGILADPEPKARIKGVTGIGIDYKVKYWVDCSKAGPGKARHAVLYSVLDQLHQAGISLAYNKQDVFYAPMPQRQLDTDNKADRVRLLSRVELFSTLPDEELETLAREMRSHVVPQGTALITQGEAGSSMFILVEGLLNVSITFPGEASPVKVGQVQPGGFFGEMSLLTGEPRTATVTAATEVMAYEITFPQVEALFDRRPQLVPVLSQVIAARRLRNDAAFASASAEEQSNQRTALADQIVDRIRMFFRSAAPVV
jgi:small-conductance mechanosensitive channel/CRP-like cAMP-binding protein